MATKNPDREKDICRVDAQQESLKDDPTNSGSMQDRPVSNLSQLQLTSAGGQTPLLREWMLYR